MPMPETYRLGPCALRLAPWGLSRIGRMYLHTYTYLNI